MKTKLIFKCARCGTEYEDTTRRFSLGRMKWHTIRYSQYSESEFGCVEKDPVDLCDTCYDALKAFMTMDDSAEFYNNQIQEKERRLSNLKESLKIAKEERDMWKKESEKVSQDFKSCEVFCPRRNSDWEEYCKWRNEKERKERGLTDKGVIC